jgi:DNA processing protein
VGNTADYMDQSIYYHCLNLLPGMGAKSIRLAVAHFGSAQGAWSASHTAWRDFGLMKDAALEKLWTKKETVVPEEEAVKLEGLGIRVLCIEDSLYPQLLREIPAPPALLYVRGQYTAWNADPCIAIVGSRKCTHYGEEVAQRLGKELATYGFTVVSGLAFGIDALSHQGALASGGHTVAVLGSGVDDSAITPRTHLKLATELLESGGSIVSEFAPGSEPTIGTFPARNRIMAGMCLGTIVVEAAEESGSLITARLTIDYNRALFSVPGSIFSSASSGTNRLLRDGARLLTSAKDVVEELEPLLRSYQSRVVPTESDTADAEGGSNSVSSLSTEEQTVLKFLSHEPTHIDQIAEKSPLDSSITTATLTMLELRGRIKNIGDMRYIRVL